MKYIFTIDINEPDEWFETDDGRVLGSTPYTVEIETDDLPYVLDRLYSRQHKAGWPNTIITYTLVSQTEAF